MSSRQLNSNVLLSKHTVTSVAFLTKYVVHKEKTFNLFQDNQPKRNIRQKPVTHWKSNMVISFIKEPFNLYKNSIPFEISHMLQLDSKSRYMPLVYISDSRFSSNDLMPIPKGADTMPLHLVFEPLTIGRIRFLLLLDKAFSMMLRFGFGEKEIDDVKAIFFDTNAHMLLITIVIISFHVSLF